MIFVTLVALFGLLHKLCWLFCFGLAFDGV